MTITEQTFKSAAGELFAVLVNPDTYPQWLVGTKNIRDVAPDWPRPGSFFKHTVGFGPLTIADKTTVRAVDAPRTLEMLVRARPALEAVVRFEVISKSDGCKVIMTETPVGVYKFVSLLAQPLIRARNERSMKRLKDLVDPQGAE